MTANIAQQPLIQLPNKDLYRPYLCTDVEVIAADAEVVPEAAQNPVNRAMAQILRQAAGARELTCHWCGQQGDEKYLRQHITNDHKANLNPATAADAALATLARAQKAEIEAKE